MPHRASVNQEGSAGSGKSPPPSHPSQWIGTTLAALFWISATATVTAALVFALLPRSVTFDLGSAPRIERVAENLYRAEFNRSIPGECLLRLKGNALTRVNDPASVKTHDAQFFLDGDAGAVVWSSNVDALARKQLFSYSLTTHPHARPPLRRRALWLLIPTLAMLLCGFGATMLSRRIGTDGRPNTEPERTTASSRIVSSIGTTAPSPIWARIGLVATCAVCLSAALAPGWNRLVSAPDSNSYVTHSEMRTPLVPDWIDAFDSQRGVDRTADLFDEFGVVNHWGGSHRFIGSLRAWKLLLVASICLLVWRLSEFLHWWQVGGIIGAAVSIDVALGPWSRGMTGYLDVVLSEGLSHALTILCIALVAGYLARPGWIRGLPVALCVNLLLLARPGNVPFVALFGLIWLFHLRRDTFRFATLRAGVLAAITFGGILLHCGINYSIHGHFKQHAFTGFNLMTTALQLATPDDAALFDEPELKEFVRVCTVDLAHKRNPELTDAAATQNCWQLACPAYSQVFGETVFVDPYKADALFTTVARSLLRRHAAEFARQVAGSFFRGFWTAWLHLSLLLVIAVSIWKFTRTGDWPWLFLAWFAALPFLTVGPCCLTNTPLDRYRSQTYFAELWSVPMWLAVVHCRWSQHRRGAKSECSIPDDEMSGGCLAQHSTRAKSLREPASSGVTFSRR